MQMNLDEVSEYLPRLLRRLIKIEGSKGTLWMSLTGKPYSNNCPLPAIIVSFPHHPWQHMTTRLSGFCPGRAQMRRIEGGRGQGGQGTTNRLRLVTAYLFSKIGQDHASWYQKIKSDHPSPTSRGLVIMFAIIH